MTSDLSSALEVCCNNSVLYKSMYTLLCITIKVKTAIPIAMGSIISLWHCRPPVTNNHFWRDGWWNVWVFQQFWRDVDGVPGIQKLRDQSLKSQGSDGTGSELLTWNLTRPDSGVVDLLTDLGLMICECRLRLILQTNHFAWCRECYNKAETRVTRLVWHTDPWPDPN